LTLWAMETSTRAICESSTSQIAYFSTLRPSGFACQHFSFLFLLKADLSSLDVQLAVDLCLGKSHWPIVLWGPSACVHSKIQTPDPSGGPLRCFSVFCAAGLVPWAAKAIAGILLPMLGVRADPPEIHRREIHGRSQLAPDLSTGIKLALLHLR
jgi:hypothetical protein